MGLRAILESAAFRDTDASLPLALGQDPTGAPVLADLARLPHLLVAGMAGAGKSVGLNAMLVSLLYRLSPDQCRLLLIDPEVRELSLYDGIPHLLCPVVTDPERSAAALGWLVTEMQERHRRMKRLGVPNIDVFNNRVRYMQKRGEPAAHRGPDSNLAPLPYIVVVIGDLAELMCLTRAEVEDTIAQLAQKARAAGIHLVAAAGQASVDVVSPAVKAGFPARAVYKVASRLDSRTLLNQQGAEQLLGEGDMLFVGGVGRMLRVQGAYVSDQEIENITAFLREECEPLYVDGLVDPSQQHSVRGGRRTSRR